MRTVGGSVPEAVMKIIARNRSIYDCMRMDLINYTALAVRIQPEVERALDSAVNLNTIVVAIKRYADKLAGDDNGTSREEPVLKNARVVLTDGMMDVRFSTEEFDRMGGATEVLAKFAKMGGNYEFFRVSDSFRFLAEDMEGVRDLFRDVQDERGEGMFSTGLAKIRIVVPAIGSSPSDVVSYVAEVLHASGIEMVNAYFGEDDIALIVREKDAARAYSVLHSEISRG